MDTEGQSTRVWVGYRATGAVALILLVTLVITLISVNAQTAGFAYLITILLVAGYLGLAESVAASITATACLNYFFLPPIGRFTIADIQNWIALFAFLATSLVASQLSNRAKQRALEATTRQAEMERLYALSRATMLLDNSEPIARQIAGEIARIYNLPAVAIFDRGSGATYVTGPMESTGVNNILRDVAMTGANTHLERDGLLVAPVALGGQPTGSIAIRDGAISDAALHAVLNLIAISLENARSRDMATRAEAARQSEEFKSTLIDGVAHEFKTPLTCIKAATTGLLSSTVSNPEQQRELLTVIDEEADHLTGLVTEAIHLARIEAGKIHLNKVPQSVERLIADTVQQLESARDGRSIEVSVDNTAMQPVTFDTELMQLAIRQLLDNALKYSPRDTPVKVRADVRDGTLAIRVHNEGAALSESERDKVFEKFYRGAAVRDRIGGTGMGLAIAREIVRAHGGDILLESSSDRGTEFAAMLPLGQKGLK
jgi:two-component system sensor histidine kinase KdpD